MGQGQVYIQSECQFRGEEHPGIYVVRLLGEKYRYERGGFRAWALSCAHSLGKCMVRKDHCAGRNVMTAIQMYDESGHDESPAYNKRGFHARFKLSIHS